MKKIIDKKIIYTNVALVVLGIIAGIIFLVLTSSLDKLIIKNEITDFFETIKTSNHSFNNLLISFKSNMTYIIIITISSIIYLFSPLILFINFYKGLLIGFLIGSVVMTYKVKGIFYSLLMLFPHHILMTITLITYGSIMLHFIYKLMKGTYKNESINLKTFIKKIGILFLFGSTCSLISSILEIYLSPLILKMFI